MFEIAKLFLDICLLKKAPQDVPYSVWFFRMTVAIYAFTSFLVMYLSTGWWDALLQVLVGIVIIITVTFIILLLASKIARFYQTATALLGTDAMINFFATPALATIITGRAAGISNLILFGLMIWQWLISGHIFRNALSASFPFGLGVAVLYIVISYWVMATLFPQIVEVR
jgi:hypothetical protein